MRLLIFFSFFMIFDLNSAQIQKDATFTDYSEFQKVVKKFTFAKLVKAEISNAIKQENDIVYQKIGNRYLHLDAYLYKSEEKKPAVILVHGGGWKSGDKRMMKTLAQKIAENGYQCFAIEYRLSDEARYPAAINDVKKAIKFLKKNAEKFNFGKNKIAILGTSSGGQMAALIGAKYPNLVDAVINIDGILAFHHPQSKEGEVAAKWLGGTFDEKPKIWEDASPLTHVNKNSNPILFINSQFDRFHAGIDDMIKILDQYNIYSKIETIENSPHTFWMFEPWFEPTVKYVVDFLNQQFK